MLAGNEQGPIEQGNIYGCEPLPQRHLKPRQRLPNHVNREVVTCDSRAIREHSSDETSPNGFVRSRFGHFNGCEGGERQGDPSPAPSLRGVMPRARCPKFGWRDAVLKPAEIC